MNKNMAVTNPSDAAVPPPDATGPSDDMVVEAVATDDDWTPVRRYQPGTADQILVQQRSVEAHEREKAEANRPTGTEIGQVTAKLRALAAQLAEQQKQLKTAQDQLAEQQAALQAQQTEMVRRTPQPEGRTQSTGSAQVGTGEVILHTYGIAIPSGKTKAYVAISARASTPSHDATPFLEIYEDGTLVSLMTVPDILPANGVSFNQTVTGNHSYTIRGRTGTGSATLTGIQSWFTVIYYV